MDLRQIGNLFFIGFSGARLSPEVRDLLADLNPAGVILFARNIEDPLQVARLNHDLQTDAATRMREGLFIGVDQEGGRVRRLKEPFAVFPPPLQLASLQSPELALREFASVTGRELRLVGFNLDFVPVLDVLRETGSPADTVIGDRAYGFDAASVSRLGRIVIEAMRSERVIPCCKHFPGHGGTAVDSHIDLPVDERDKAALVKSDLVPFAAAIEMKVEMTMTAHVLYRSLDPEFPATLSRKVISGMLRKEMGFDGVVITDDLDMGAVADRYAPEESAYLAFSAGVDLLLICNDPSKAFSARARLLQALKDGEIPAERLKESLARVRRLKALYADSMRPCEQMRVREYFRAAGI